MVKLRMFHDCKDFGAKMDEKTVQQEGSRSSVANERNDDPGIGPVPSNEKYQVVKDISENFFCGNAQSERIDDEMICNMENLKFFDEYPETSHSKWIDSVRKGTRVLEQWWRQTKIHVQPIQGEAFVQCSLPHPHPHGDLPSAKEDKGGDFGNTNYLTLEATLSRISKTRKGKLQNSQNNAVHRFSPDFKTGGSGRVPHDALALYCQEHAYSRTRLLRTDRRTLANELLEELAIDFNGEVSLPQSDPHQSDHKYIPEPARLSSQRFHANTSNEANASITRKSCEENLGRNDSNQSHNSHFSFTGRPHLNSKNSGSERKESGDGKHVHKTVKKDSFADEMHESFKVTPCVLLQSQVLGEPRHRLFRRH